MSLSLDTLVAARHPTLAMYAATSLTLDADGALLIDNSAAGTSSRYSLAVVKPTPALAYSLDAPCYELVLEFQFRPYAASLYRAGAGPGFVFYAAATAPPEPTIGAEVQVVGGVADVYAATAWFADNFTSTTARDALQVQQCGLYACRTGCARSCAYARNGAAAIDIDPTTNTSPWLRARYHVYADANESASIIVNVSVEDATTATLLIEHQWTRSVASVPRPRSLAFGAVRTSVAVRAIAYEPTCVAPTPTPTMRSASPTSSPTLFFTPAPSLAPSPRPTLATTSTSFVVLPSPPPMHVHRAMAPSHTFTWLTTALFVIYAVLMFLARRHTLAAATVARRRATLDAVARAERDARMYDWVPDVKDIVRVDVLADDD